MSYPNVILLTGPIGAQAQCGKDTAAAYLVERGWIAMAFADPLKSMAVAVNPWVEIKDTDLEKLSDKSVERITGAAIVKTSKGDLSGSFFRLAELVEMLGWEEAKKIKDVREFLQKLGTEGVRATFGDDAWLNLAYGAIRRLTQEGKKVVVKDARFANEVIPFRKETEFFACVYRIVREGSGAGTHVSEAGIPDELVDGVIDNNGSLEELQKRILEVAGEADDESR